MWSPGRTLDFNSCVRLGCMYWHENPPSESAGDSPGQLSVCPGRESELPQLTGGCELRTARPFSSVDVTALCCSHSRCNGIGHLTRCDGIGGSRWVLGQVFGFGGVELDVGCLELRRGGQRVEVQPKVMRLLVHLVVNRHRVVSTEELQSTLWPEVSVGAGSLKRAILGARQVLGEQGDSPSSIRTLRGLGYQFVSPVEVRASGPSLHVPVAEPGRSAFFGREYVMELLSTCISEVMRGESRSVFLTGVPGVGKSRTLEELSTLASSAGMDVWLGRCSNLEGAPAFWPFIQLLRAAVRERGARDIRALMEDGAADLAAVMPELRQVLTNLPIAEDASHATRFRLFDSFAMFLGRAARQRPLLIAIDDLHHADPATLQLLTFVLRSVERVPLLISATSRLDPSAPDALVSGLLREPSVHCVELSGLTRAALEQCVAHMLGRALPPSALDALHERTAGNPLFVRQLIERQRAAESDDFSELHLSSGLQAAIERHLESVSVRCRRALQLAAVLGREFSSALLARVTSEPIEALWRDLAEAASSQLIEPTGDELGRFRFTHSLIQEALYRQMPHDERSRLHGAVGRAIEAHGIGDNHVLLSEVTHHFVHAAPAHDGGRALGYCMRAGEIAQGPARVRRSRRAFRACASAQRVCSSGPASPHDAAVPQGRGARAYLRACRRTRGAV